MSRRGAAAEATRRRIVDATRALHNEQGIAGTSWEDIAQRAGVGVGTVYRHFPSLDELVPACGAVSMQIVALPALEDVPGLFADRETPRARIERLVAVAFGIYERGAGDVRAVRLEPDVHPAVGAAGRHLDAVLGALVEEALAPLDAAAPDRRVARAMVDLEVWQALRDQGLTPEQVRGAVADMLAGRPG